MMEIVVLIKKQPAHFITTEMGCQTRHCKLVKKSTYLVLCGSVRVELRFFTWVCLWLL